MKKTAVVFLTLVILFTLCGCGRSELCGKWHSQQEGNTVIFNDDGSFKLNFWDGDSLDGTFVIDKAADNGGLRNYTLTLRDNEGRKQTIDVKINGDEMTLANGIYKKQ